MPYYRKLIDSEQKLEYLQKMNSTEEGTSAARLGLIMKNASLIMMQFQNIPNEETKLRRRQVASLKEANQQFRIYLSEAEKANERLQQQRIAVESELNWLE